MVSLMFCKVNLRHDIVSGKIPGVFILSFFLVQFFFSGSGNYMLETGRKMQAVELFSFSLTSPVTYLFFFLAMMVLLSGIPRVNGNAFCYLIRSDRTRWFVGQCLYNLLLSAGYMTWLLLCYLVALKGQFTFNNNWSEPIYLVAQTGIVQDVGININIWISYEIIQNYTPVSLFATILFVQMLLMFLLGVVFMVFTFFDWKKISYVIVVLLWAESFGFQQFNVKPSLWKLCPVGASWPSFWNYGYLKGAPTLKFVVIEYSVLIIMLLLLAKKRLKYFEF